MRIRYLQAALVVWAMIALGSCSKLCRSGYEGSECNEVVRGKFEGAWNAVDTPGNMPYRDSIYDAPSIGNVLLSNAFANHYFNNPITVNASDKNLTIAYQRPDSAAKYVQGSAQLNSAGNSLIWTYQLTDSTQITPVITGYTGTWTK